MTSSLRIPEFKCWPKASFLIVCLFLVGAWPIEAQVPTLLHSFAGGIDGGGPVSTLIRDSVGNLYGATYSGGGHGGFGQGSGAVFQLSPDGNGRWSETVLYQFTGGADGLNPYGTLLLDGKGNLYGTTLSGGGHKMGTGCNLTPQSSSGG